MPLWTKAKRWRSSAWGWALAWVTPPWVAQRVWPMPRNPSNPAARTASASSATLPTSLMVRNPSAVHTASPAESYPRYSSRRNPSNNTSQALRGPTYPTIPHIKTFSSLAVRRRWHGLCSGITRRSLSLPRSPSDPLGHPPKVRYSPDLVHRLLCPVFSGGIEGLWRFWRLTQTLKFF